MSADLSPLHFPQAVYSRVSPSPSAIPDYRGDTCTGPTSARHAYGYALAPVLPVPVSSQKETQAMSDTLRSALITFTGTLCLSIIAAAYAIADDFKTSHALVASMFFGALGGLFSLAALWLDHGRGGAHFLILSLVGAAIGTICMVAATQVWVITLLMSVCIVTTGGVVWWLRAREVSCYQRGLGASTSTRRDDDNPSLLG